MKHLLSFPGQRNGSRVYHGGDGFFYHISNNRPNRRFAYLRCIHANSASIGCAGTARALIGRNLLWHMQLHSHTSNVWYPHILALKADIIARVRTGDQTAFHEIIQQEGQRYPIEVRAQLASGSFINRLNAIRAELRPIVPRNLGILGAHLLEPQYRYLTSCLHVPDSLFAGCCGLLADGTLSLVFISPEMKIFMESRNIVFADGTGRKLFRKPKASQIYQIVTAWRFHVIPMLKAIMQKRTFNAYLVLFEYIRTLMPAFSPSTVKCDFEDAQTAAWQTAFPQVLVEGCLWHFDVAIFRRAKNNLGLYRLVKEEEEVAAIIRSAGALPLLSSHEIEFGLEDLGWEAFEKGWMPNLRPFFQYMQREWMPKVNVLSVKDSIHRTNNVCESANRSLNKEIKAANPSCFNVIRAFVVTNDRAMVDMRTLDAGLAPGRSRKISALRNDALIRRLTLDFENGDITRLQFLHKASRRMQKVFNQWFRDPWKRCGVCHSPCSEDELFLLEPCGHYPYCRNCVASLQTNFANLPSFLRQSVGTTMKMRCPNCNEGALDFLKVQFSE